MHTGAAATHGSSSRFETMLQRESRATQRRSLSVPWCDMRTTLGCGVGRVAAGSDSIVIQCRHTLNLFRSNLHNKSLIMCCRLSYCEVNCTEKDYIAYVYMYYYCRVLSHYFIRKCTSMCAQFHEILHAEIKLKRDLILMGTLSALFFFSSSCKSRVQYGGIYHKVEMREDLLGWK